MSKNKIFTIFILCFLIGVFIAPLFSFNDLVLFITPLLLIFIAILFRNDTIVKIAAFSAVFLVFGFWHFYYAIPEFSQNFIGSFGEKEIEIYGFISSYPQEKDKSESFIINASRIKEGDEWKDVNGKINITISKIKEFEYGDNIYLKGNLENIENSSDFNSKEFFASRKIYTKMFWPDAIKEEGNSGNFVMRILFEIRKAFERNVNQVFVEPFSSLVLGIILGVKKVSKELTEIFNIVSISHIIVISGYNISVIADFSRKIFENFSRRVSFWFPLVSIIFFTLFVGADPPVVRASLMACVLLLAKRKGRKTNGIFMLLFAAFVMIILNPFLLRYDPGFQLSFLATLGLILISEKMLKLFKKAKIPFIFSEALASTIAAQIFILPIIIFYFGRLSLISPIANVLILPLIPFTMFSAFVVVLIGFLNLDLARFLSLIPTFCLFYLIKVSTILSQVSWASLSLQKSGIFVYFYYSVLGFPYLIKKRKHEKDTPAS